MTKGAAHQRFLNFFVWLWKKIPLFDLYGDAIKTDPSRFPRTVEGAFLSVICVGIVIALILVDIVKLNIAANGTEVHNTPLLCNKNLSDYDNRMDEEHLFPYLPRK